MLKRRFSPRMTGFIFLLPALLFIIGATVIPFVWNLILSFQEWDGFGAATWNGIQNYQTLADPKIREALWNSILYAITSTAGGVVVGLFLATLLYRLSNKEGSVFRLILYSPAMIPTAVVGLMFVFFFNPEMGLLNSLLRVLGLESLTHIWLQEKETAMACIIFVAIWKCAGMVMIMTFAAMQTIPKSLYESSELDGARFWTQMWFITYPLIKPMILLATINTLGAQYKSYDLIFTMTQGGPGTLTTTVPILMTKRAFNFGDFGTSAALGVLFTAIVAVSIIVVRRLLKGEEYEF